MTTRHILATGVIVAVIFIYFPTRHATHYSFIEDEDVYQELALEAQQGPNQREPCEYRDLIIHNQDISIFSSLPYEVYANLKTGGEYIPPSCHPGVSVAIVVPYRNRTEQLRTFLRHMHPFLQRQNIRYRVLIVEQGDARPFNRARMMNHGVRFAMSLNYSCLVLHDVDLLPVNTGNLYACTHMPRHMSSSLDTFRYNLPYETLFGGVVSILSNQFKHVNGMSNLYYGWGGEDDDFYRRLAFHGLIPCRFSPRISRYTMLVHSKGKPSPERHRRLLTAEARHLEDGLNTLGDDRRVLLRPTYTHIIAT